MARAKESRDLIMSQFKEGFFSKPEETDLLRECAVTVPVQRQSNKKYYEDKEEVLALKCPSKFVRFCIENFWNLLHK